MTPKKIEELRKALETLNKFLNNEWEEIEEVREALETLNHFLNNEWEEFEGALANKDRPKSFKETKVTNLMREIGVPVHIKGYQYLREAIIIFWEKKSCEKISITKGLYPQIAEKFNTTPSRVERAIRHAIEVSWYRGDTDVLNSIFGYTVDKRKGKPTNHECIALLADYLKST